LLPWPQTERVKPNTEEDRSKNTIVPNDTIPNVRHPTDRKGRMQESTSIRASESDDQSEKGKKTTAVRHTANGLEPGCFNLATNREGQTKH
jgi:hypothetical protein